jgi:opacity protein-like surface antigen
MVNIDGNSAPASGLRKIRLARISALLGGFAAALALPAGPAMAQSLVQGPCVSTGQTAAFNGGAGLGAVPFASGGGINSLVSAINVANTAFLSQSTAFIGAPPNPEPEQLGGGVWARGIGGQTDFKSTSSSNYTFGGAPLTGGITCNTTTKLNFAGVQIGTDAAQLNVDGWNLHAGSTLGYIGTYSNDFATGGTFQDNLQIPFVGIYAAATKGGFFADAQARWNYYQNRITDQTNGVFNQDVDARGFSINGNVGYNYGLTDNWFIEPSAGFLWSEVWVDPFNTAGTFVFQPPISPAVNLAVPGTVSINNIYSALGRVSLRVGTSISTENWILQPFATISGFREFEGNNSGSVLVNATTTGPITAINPGLSFICHSFTGATVPCTLGGQLSATNIGNYGQFGLGVVTVIPNTGWLGYLRADYRTGDHIDGWSMNGGIRYQLSPSHTVITGRSAEILGAPIAPAAYNWTGFYLGPQLGADWGYTNWTFADAFGTKTYPRFAGILPGGQIGYNYQYDKWVFGIEGTAGWTNAHGARACSNGLFFDPTSFFVTCEINVNSLYTVTGRIGYAYFDRVLWYGKAGLAIGEVTAQGRCNTDSLLTPALATGGLLNPGCPTSGTSNTAAGWTLGGGSELGLTDNWSVKAETSYFNLGSHQYSFGALAGPTGAIPVTLPNASVRRDGWITTIGLNYRFTGFEAPAVVAKY